MQDAFDEELREVDEDEFAAFEAEMAQKRGEARARKRRIILAVVALISAGVAAAAVLTAPPSEDERMNRASAYSHIASFEELHDLDGDWVGVVASDWAGAADPAVALTACEALRAEVALGEGRTVLIATADGDTLAECGAE
ncbi:MAG: hypothetical protein H6739_08955 [Alphaproteobacteria bacterium]|nr:hypothetical protein [Alphaproteobacteria bacterium]